jgi:hypothetical protein
MTKRVVAFCAALLVTFAVVLTTAVWGATFGIDGGTSSALHPGSTVPINVRISNPHFYPITVSDLTVRIASITPEHKGATCRVSNYTVTQARHFSARIPALSSVGIRTILSNSSEWPSLHLTADLTKIDGGCQGATINLAYSAAGSWWIK